jgi:phospholipid-binding lipoprotein MlaA
MRLYNRIMLTKLPRFIATLILISLVSACTTVQKSPSAEPEMVNVDPFESTNRSVYRFNDGLDRYFVKPVASTYASITPDLVQTGVTNFFNNISYLNVVVNSSLQGKLDQGMSDLFRFVFNSTLGVAGLFDVATPLGIPANKEDLGQTFAVWGSGQGPYLTLPLFGPNTLRDAPDLVTSLFLNPISYLASAVSLPATALNIVNRRANLLEAKSMLDEAALDPYSFTREAYLQQRLYLIHDGAPPTDGAEDIFDEEIFDNN